MCLRRALDPLELEFQTIVSHLVASGTRTRVLLQEQLVLFTAEPSLQPGIEHLRTNKVCFLWLEQAEEP